jgi:hypothetical protein
MKDLTSKGWDNVKPNVQTYNALISTWANSRQPGAGQRAEALLAGQDEPVASEQVLQLAHSSRCSAYDCEFVAAAQQLGVPLVTEDRAVLVAFPDVARPLA